MKIDSIESKQKEDIKILNEKINKIKNTNKINNTNKDDGTYNPETYKVTVEGGYE